MCVFSFLHFELFFPIIKPANPHSWWGFFSFKEQY
jgi:hypothetical protein